MDITLIHPRPRLIKLLIWLRLYKFRWARWLGCRHISRKVTDCDPTTGTITVDKPFPRDKSLEGKYIIEAKS